MQVLLYINPLKKGKLSEYKAFTQEITGPGKREYNDLLKRYGLITAKVYYHKLAGKEFVIVYHDAEDNAQELLAKFPKSTHPYDLWFVERLTALHEFDSLEGDPLAKCIFTYDVRKH